MVISLKLPIQQLFCISLVHKGDSPNWKMGSFPRLYQETFNTLPFNEPDFSIYESA